MKNFFKPLFNQTNRIPVTQVKNWRVGMWVITQDYKVGILFTLDSPCRVHIVDKETGETTEQLSYDISSLRQANWSEIPGCRKIGITKQQGEALGYGS